MQKQWFDCYIEIRVLEDEDDAEAKMILHFKAEVQARSHEEAETLAKREFRKARINDRFLDYGMYVSLGGEWDIKPFKP